MNKANFSALHNYNSNIFNNKTANCSVTSTNDRINQDNHYIFEGDTITVTCNNGYTWNGTFFPASGFRRSSDGTLNNVGSNGYCWSSAANSQDNAYNLNFNSGNVNPQNNNNRANGFSVRPVSE